MIKSPYVRQQNAIVLVDQAKIEINPNIMDIQIATAIPVIAVPTIGGLERASIGGNVFTIMLEDKPAH